MKLILLAAAAVIAMPAMAQQSGSTGTSSPTTSGAQSAVPPTAGDNSMPSQSMPNQSMPSQSMPAAPMASGDPVGGYQPAAAPTAGVFQAGPTPDQAYPAPAPLAHYPVCKKGEFDKCIQGPRSTHSREVRGRKS